MRFEKKFLLLIIFIFLSTSVHADQIYRRPLTAQEIERVRAVKELLQGIDKEPLYKTIHDLEKARHPEINLEMKEAMAKTFMDIVTAMNVEGQKKKEWLYSMVCLNMAYLQFGGTQGKYGSTTELNRLIRKKLIQYLPPDVLNQPGFIHSLE